jgi:hypothetical protein
MAILPAQGEWVVFLLCLSRPGCASERKVMEAVS